MMARPHPGLIVAILIVGLAASALWGLLTQTNADWARLVVIGPYLRRVLLFTLAQAAISTCLSLVLGAMVALALARRPVFPGRALIMALVSAAFVMPAIVVVFGVVAAFGQNGFVTTMLRSLGLWQGTSLYGWPGILMAHVAMNAALATRVFHDALFRAAPNHLRLAHMLGFSPRDMWHHLDRPILRREAPALGIFVFLLCATSFAVVLTLGGGPAQSTLEVAIYEAIRVEADFARAGAFAFIQVAFGLALAGIGLCLSNLSRAEAAAGYRIARPDRFLTATRLFDACALAAMLALIGPIMLSVLGGVPALPAILDKDSLAALMTSLMLAVPSAMLSTALAILLAMAARRSTGSLARGLIRSAPFVFIALPPFAFVVGIYMPLRRLADPGTIAPLLVPLVNALMALPFALRFVEPPILLADARHGRLADHLGLRGLNRLRILDRPFLMAPAAAACLTACALSFGDFGVAALFASGEFRTLPVLLHERLNAYRHAEAAALALLIMSTVLALSLLADRLTHARHR
jgi:thiamine transport system permease protein